jgi:hypothetical protein
LQRFGDGVALLVVAAIIVVFVVISLLRGVGYSLGPIGRVTRREDPFTFWLWIGIPMVFVVFLATGAVIELLPK